MAIIEEFFRNNPDIFLYQCETGDNLTLKKYIFIPTSLT